MDLNQFSASILASLADSGVDIIRGEKPARREHDRSDRATVEQVLDPRTRLILFRLIQRGVFDSLEGCVSTGKEANVYHAVCSSGNGYAVKVFKTSILTFKDRDRYVTGEFRLASLFILSSQLNSIFQIPNRIFET
jgi:RIO kinase 1